MISRRVFIALSAGILFLSCAALVRFLTAPRNLFQNPSFEQGRSAWTWRVDSPSWSDFEITDERAHQGRHSAHLRLKTMPPSPVAQIWGVIQVPAVHRMPGELSFWYQVENWRPAAGKQYAQAVVMVHDKGLLATIGEETLQIRYILAGLDGPPYEKVRNARYLMAGSREPPQEGWLRFRTNVKEDFLKVWDFSPKSFDKIEFFFEVRYDDPIPPGQSADADVYWDDFFLSRE